MNFFRRRPRQIVVTHKGLGALVKAINRLADAQAGLIRPPEPPPQPAPVVPERTKVFLAWLDAQGFPEAQHRHYGGAFKVMMNEMPCPQGYSRGQLIAELVEAGAPLG